MPGPLPRLALDVHRATPDDLDAVVSLLHQAYHWLLAQGITDQWIKPFPVEAVAELIDRGEVYIATHDAKPIATFTLTYAPDAELWGNPPDDAGYIRRLVVDREHAGHDIGGQLLDYAGHLVAVAGRPRLRLDCAKDNARLHDYYRAHGFTHLATLDLAHRQSGALFERAAAAADIRLRPSDRTAML